MNNICKFPQDKINNVSQDEFNYKEQFTKVDIKRVNEIEKKIKKLIKEQNKICAKIDLYNSISIQIKALEYELIELYNKNIND